MVIVVVFDVVVVVVVVAVVVAAALEFIKEGVNVSGCKLELTYCLKSFFFLIRELETSLVLFFISSKRLFQNPFPLISETLKTRSHLAFPPKGEIFPVFRCHDNVKSWKDAP